MYGKQCFIDLLLFQDLKKQGVLGHISTRKLLDMASIEVS